MAIKRIVLEPSTNKLELETTTNEIYLNPFSTNEILNGGGESTTDWINPNLGLAEWWKENELL